MKKRAVLLDALGTLVALEPPGPRLAEQLRDAHGIELSRQEASRAFAVEIAHYRDHHLQGRDADSLRALRQRCAEVLHGALPTAAARRIAVAQLQEAMLGALRFTAYPDALATLPLLRARGLALVVVSNWDISLPGVLREAGFEKAGGLGKAGVEEVFDTVLSSAQVGSAKPAPQIFQTALACAGVSAEEALHVGDSPQQDVAGALSAGVAPVLLRRAGARRAPAGVRTISSLAELPGMLT